MKLITVNIEGNKHLLDIGNLIAVEQPDVLCLQEVFATDLPAIGLPLISILRRNNFCRQRQRSGRK